MNPNSNEQFRFWQHLANAGLIEGSYSGIEGASGQRDAVVFGINAPQSKMGNAGWGARHWASMPFITNRQAMNFGAMVANNYNSGGVLTPTEAWNVEKKVDDGSPATGNVRQIHATLTCVSDATAAATYLLSGSAKDCAMTLLIK
jgi:hypothetical protein